MYLSLNFILIMQALAEEKYDMAVRFHEQYREYRHTTRMFGPAWLWSMIVVAILFIAGSGWQH